MDEYIPKDNGLPKDYQDGHFKEEGLGFYGYQSLQGDHMRQASDKRLTGDGEMKLQKKGKLPNSGLLYSHQPLHANSNSRYMPSKRYSS